MCHGVVNGSGDLANLNCGNDTAVDGQKIVVDVQNGVAGGQNDAEFHHSVHDAIVVDALMGGVDDDVLADEMDGFCDDVWADGVDRDV